MKINENIRLELAGENALMLYFSVENCEFANSEQTITINAKISDSVQQALLLINDNFSTEVVDLIPSYASILVMFDLQKIDHYQLCNKLHTVLASCRHSKTRQGKLIELPVYYALESGPDLQRIAKHAKLSVEEVVSIHQSQEYRVYAIGFAPGFAYLGEVDERIAMPRLATPRLKVPKGAVAIADRQTAVYPALSPGGWNIIGSCPIDMFNPQAEPIMPVAVGDKVRFIAIDKAKYLELSAEQYGSIVGSIDET